MKILRMMVYNHALILVPTLYFSLLASALYKVSWKRSCAASLSLVKVMAKGFKNSALLTNNWLNSKVDIHALFKKLTRKIKHILPDLPKIILESYVKSKFQTTPLHRVNQLLLWRNRLKYWKHIPIL